MKKKDVKAAILTLLCIIYGYMPWGFAQTQPNAAAAASQIRITGIVSDDMGVLPDVAVFIKGSKKGTLTDFDGAYEIDAQPQDILVFSYVGYTTVETVVGARNVIHIKLAQEVTALKGVEVNAGYYMVKEREGTGNIGKITSKEIAMQPISNPLAALQGRVAGVEIQQTSGIPGAGFSIKIRGQNSIRSTGNDPLYIVDGMPYASATLGDRQTSGGILPDDGFSPLNNINPSDIENIEILKDADATAIYGARGANGVVLITTKKGSSQSTNFTLNMSTGLGSAAHQIEVLNTSDYLTMRREASANDGISIYPSNAYDVNGTWDQNRQTNWQKKLFGNTAYLTQISGSLSGGNAQTQFLFSGNYYKQTTVFQGEFNNTKVSFLSNVKHQSKNNRFSVQFSLNYMNNHNVLPPTSLVRDALLLPPNAPELYKDDGTLNWENSTWNNPLRNLEGKYLANGSSLIGNMALKYQIVKGLSFSTSAGYTESGLKELKTSPSTKYNPAYGLDSKSSSGTHNTSDRQSWRIEPQLDGNFNVGSTTITSLVGLTFQEQKSNKLSQYASVYTNNSLIENIAAATNITVFDDTQTQYRYHAIFGRINLNHQRKYLLNLTGRRDGSSRFGANKKFANFMAVGAAWVFSNETFSKETIPFLSFGKLRGSYGTSGNDQIGDYQYLDTYSFGSSQYQETIGLNPTRLYNPDFSWEINKKKELALELGFLNDRIFLSSSYYQNKSSNQLVGIPLPGTTGFSSLNANLNATVENTGWEFELSTKNMERDKLKWSTSFNLTIPKNKLVEFPDLDGSTYANTLVIGESLNILKVYESKGVNPQTGLFEFIDFNNDGLISAPYDTQVVKDLNPKFYGGVNNSLSFGKLTMDFLVQFTKQLGIDYMATGAITGTMNNKPTQVLQRWQNVGDQASIQRFTSGSNQEGSISFSNYSQSDAAISDASYLRLKTLSVSYQLATKANDGLGCQLYLRGQNLLTFTHYNGLDPEIRSSFTVPPLRFVTVGTIISF